MPPKVQKSCDALIAVLREELRRGLAKLYNDPSSAPLGAGEPTNPNFQNPIIAKENSA